jgi:hypothetical protein
MQEKAREEVIKIIGNEVKIPTVQQLKVQKLLFIFFHYTRSLETKNLKISH